MILTLAAGLASTVFAPLSVALADRFDWRTTYLVLAVIRAVITIPGHVWGFRGRWPDPIRLPHAQSGDHRRTSSIPASLTPTVTIVEGAFPSFARLFNPSSLSILMGYRPLPA